MKWEMCVDVGMGVVIGMRGVLLSGRASRRLLFALVRATKTIACPKIQEQILGAWLMNNNQFQSSLRERLRSVW